MKILDTAVAFLIIKLLRASNTSAATSCFLPSGDPGGDPPCDPHAPVSMCCGNPAECLSNGLCFNPKYDPYPGANISFARGTCTDDQWGSSICPQVCLASRCFLLLLDSRTQAVRFTAAKCFLSDRSRQRRKCFGHQFQNPCRSSLGVRRR